MVDDSAPNCAAQPFELSAFPNALRPVSDLLADHGQAAYWVGPSLLQMIEGSRPNAYSLATSASQQQLTSWFPSAVPLADAYGSVMIPSAAGPIDAFPFRHGREIEVELSHIDFTIHALAYDARESTLLDPFEGLVDLSAGRLRAVRSAIDRLAEDPLRGLRAIRLVATRGLKLEPTLELALADVCLPLEAIPRIRVREELTATILAPGVAQAWPLLERSGISSQLAPNARVGAGTLIEVLPCDLALRLGAWLSGARSRRALQRLRFSRMIVDRVEHLLQLHPIETHVDTSKLPAVARLTRRESTRDLNALIALRRAELRLEGSKDGDALASLDSLEHGLSELRAQRSIKPHSRLAINGEEIMSELNCPPGPRIGRAVAYLSEQITENPEHNEPEKLRALLRGWLAGEPAS
jgi:tRNA nucleotidyltransferase/poly(A) polymerase